MRAKDIMTENVVSVEPATSVEHVARLMLEHHISAVPVIDDAFRVVGIVSEGDLMRRPETGAPPRRPWWLGLLDSPDAIATEYLKSHGLLSRDVMTEDVVTVDEDTPVSEIPVLLDEHQIKRVPVLANGRIVGIVSRADLLPLIAKGWPGLISDIAKRKKRRRGATLAPSTRSNSTIP